VVMLSHGKTGVRLTYLAYCNVEESVIFVLSQKNVIYSR